MKFNKTNRIGDDVDLDVDWLAETFTASTEFAAWVAEHGSEPLEKVLMRWCLDHFGGWDADEWDALADEVVTSWQLERSKDRG